MGQSSKDIDAARIAIRKRLEEEPALSEADKAALNAEWLKLDKLLAVIQDELFDQVTQEVAAATNNLRAVVASGKTDPIQQFIANLREASASVTGALNGAKDGAQVSPVVVKDQNDPAGPAELGKSPSLSALQQSTIKAIINIFETGTVRGDYANITLIPGDTGGLTYGRSQTTLNGGGLRELIADYCADLQRPFARHLSQYSERLAAKDNALNGDIHFQNLLRAAADYRIMRDIQDVFFDRFYWMKAAAAASNLGVKTPLGTAVIYDGFVHGSFDLIRRDTDRSFGTLEAKGEKIWISKYIDTRDSWLENSSRADLRATVYRTRTFKTLIASELWDLPIPLVVRSVQIDVASLNGQPIGVYNGPVPKSRDLALGHSILAGQDVRHVQVRLSAHDVGSSVRADGLYGPSTQGAVRDYQSTAGLPQTGIVDLATFSRMGF